MNKIKQQLNQNITDTMPDLLEQLLDTPVTPLTEHDFITKQEVPSASHPFVERLQEWYSYTVLRKGLSFALCFLLLVSLSGGLFFNTTYVKADSLVSIDVNPSIELTTNKKNKVTKVTAKNEDAKALLDGMDLTRIDLNIAVNAIIGSMLKHGYLQDDNNIILVSVSNKKEEKASQIQDEIEADFADSLKVINKQATVIKQNISKDTSLEKMAEQYHISVGKLQFINQILEADESLLISDLAAMSMNELATLAEQYGIFLTPKDEETPSTNGESTEELEQPNTDDEIDLDSSLEETTIDEDTDDLDSEDSDSEPGIASDSTKDNIATTEATPSITEEAPTDSTTEQIKQDGTTNSSSSTRSNLPGKLIGNEKNNTTSPTSLEE